MSTPAGQSPTVHRSPYPDTEVPDVSLHEMVFGSLTPADADRLAFVELETGEEHTFGRVARDVDAVATWFDQRGLAVGDAVMILLPNCPQYAAAFHGIALTGAASTPANTAAVGHDLERQLRTTHASWIITDPDLLAKAVAAAGAVGIAADHVVVVGQAVEGHPSWADVVATEPDPPRGRVTDPATHVACLPVSSGTSGLPKAVMLSHRNLVANMLQFNIVLQYLGQEQSFVAFLPYSHIYAMTTNLNYGLFKRFPQFTMRSFAPQLFLEAQARRRPTLLFVVPPVAVFLARHPAAAQVRWDSIQLAICGAAPLDGPMGDALQARLGTRLVQGYGMTEMSPVTHVIPPERPDIGLGTIGMAIPNTRFRVVDPDTGRDVAVPTAGWSNSGELWVTGPNTMLGYLDAPEDTDSVLDADGWVHTGDMVQVDHEGVVQVVGRIKELIKHRGFQVPPAELEALLCTHPDVSDAAVLGLDRGNGEQVPHALLVLREGTTTTPQDVVTWFRPQVAAYKRLASASTISEVPRSSAGKVLRRELPALLSS